MTPLRFNVDFLCDELFWWSYDEPQNRWFFNATELYRARLHDMNFDHTIDLISIRGGNWSKYVHEWIDGRTIYKLVCNPIGQQSLYCWIADSGIVALSVLSQTMPSRVKYPTSKLFPSLRLYSILTRFTHARTLLHTVDATDIRRRNILVDLSTLLLSYLDTWKLTGFVSSGISST